MSGKLQDFQKWQKLPLCKAIYNKAKLPKMAFFGAKLPSEKITSEMTLEAR